MSFVAPVKKKKRDTYQLAMLWHAASSIGPPCVKNVGPKVEINSVNKVGYGNWDKRTRDLCKIHGQNTIGRWKKKTHLFVTALGRPVFPLGKV